jgi:hypothetical protein
MSIIHVEVSRQSQREIHFESQEALKGATDVQNVASSAFRFGGDRLEASQSLTAAASAVARELNKHQVTPMTPHAAPATAKDKDMSLHVDRWTPVEMRKKTTAMTTQKDDAAMSARGCNLVWCAQLMLSCSGLQSCIGISQHSGEGPWLTPSSDFRQTAKPLC